MLVWLDPQGSETAEGHKQGFFQQLFERKRFRDAQFRNGRETLLGDTN